MPVPLSVLVTTYHQEVNVARCLDSVVGWASDVRVLDSFSTDRTLEIVRRYGVSVDQRSFDDFATNKNWALDHLPWTHEWILILDADEIIPKVLKEEVEGVLREGGRGRDGFYLNRRVYFLGKWLRHCGWYPSWNLRIFRRALGRYENRKVHEHLLLKGTPGYLKNDLIHDDQRGLSEWIARHNRFSSLEAEERLACLAGAKRTGFEAAFRGNPLERKRFLKERIFLYLPAKPLVWFFYLYVFRFGFLDGRAGWTFCILHAIQEYQTDLKLGELLRKKKR